MPDPTQTIARTLARLGQCVSDAQAQQVADALDRDGVLMPGEAQDAVVEARLGMTVVHPCGFCDVRGRITVADLVALVRDHTCHDDRSEELDAEGRRDDAR